VSEHAVLQVSVLAMDGMLQCWPTHQPCYSNSWHSNTWQFQAACVSKITVEHTFLPCSLRIKRRVLQFFYDLWRQMQPLCAQYIPRPLEKWSGNFCMWVQTIITTIPLSHSSFKYQISACESQFLQLMRTRLHARGSNSDTTAFTVCHVMTFWHLIGAVNFLVAEVTVWTRTEFASLRAVLQRPGNEANMELDIPLPN